MRPLLCMCAGLLAGGASAADELRIDEPIVVTANPPAEESISPRRVYQADALARFDALSVGDLLKRLPGLAFAGEAGQVETPQLRGLGQGYTQVLINGQRIDGSEEDRSLLVDRIPADLVERIELLRSPGADLDSQGVAGSINIVLKSGAAYSGGSFRADAVSAADGEPRGGGALAWGGSGGRLNWLASLSSQTSQEPRDKRVRRMDADGSQETRRAKELRETRSLGLDGRLGLRLEGGARLTLDGRRLQTRRDTDDQDRGTRVGEDGEALALQLFEREHSDDRSSRIGAGLELPLGSGGNELGARASYGRLHLRERTGLRVVETAEDDEETTEDLERTQIRDHDTQLAAEYRHGERTRRLRLGVQYGGRRRDSAQQISESEDGVMTDLNPAAANYGIEERRLDGYVVQEWQPGAGLALEAGLRLETTELEQAAVDEERQRRVARESDHSVQPSLHSRWQFSPADQLSASFARTLRRPELRQRVPFRERLERGFSVGNPGLQAERSSGFDLGYEHRDAGTSGLIGINLFHRRISGLIESIRVAEDTVSPDNLGTGRAWGAELEGQLPLRLGTPSGTNELQLSANLSLLNSSLRDPFSGQQRRFQNQPGYVFNFGIDQQFEVSRLAWGLNYRRQGDSQEILADESSRAGHESGLDAYIESDLGGGLKLRLSGSNVLGTRLRKRILGFDDDQGPRTEPEFTEDEFESLEASWTLSLRGRW